MDEVFAQRDLAEWRTILHAAGVTFGAVHSVDESATDLQFQRIGALVPFADGKGLTVSSPFHLDGESKVAPRRAPSVGQHTDEVLQRSGLLGSRDRRSCAREGCSASPAQAAASKGGWRGGHGPAVRSGGLQDDREPTRVKALAGHILDSKEAHFDASTFKDEYELALRKLVKRKASGKQIEAPQEPAAAANVIDLMQALRGSSAAGPAGCLTRPADRPIAQTLAAKPSSPKGPCGLRPGARSNCSTSSNVDTRGRVRK